VVGPLFEALLLPLVPVPLVHLAHRQAQLAGDPQNEIAVPVRVLQVLILEDLELVRVLALPAPDVAADAVVVLWLLEEGGDHFVEVGISCESVVRNVVRQMRWSHGLRRGAIVEDRAGLAADSAARAHFIYRRLVEV